MSAFVTYTTTANQFNDTEKITTDKILQILAGGGGGGGGTGTGTQLLTYVSDPTTEGIVPGNINAPAIAYKADLSGATFNWNTTTHVWG